MATSASANKTLLQRIKVVRNEVGDPDDARKLDYIVKQLTPAGLERRSEDDQDLTHLHEVAKAIIKPIEKRTGTA